LNFASQNKSFYHLLDFSSTLKLRTTALIMASKNGHGSGVDTFVQSGAEINIVTNDGATALLIAVEKGHEAIVAALIGLDRAGKMSNLVL
jgi:ankyrin repeat protein